MDGAAGVRLPPGGPPEAQQQGHRTSCRGLCDDAPGNRDEGGGAPQPHAYLQHIACRQI